MAQVYTVTGDTSLISISTIQEPYTLIYISTSIYPGHIVGIRDITASTGIINYPIILSTLSGTQFFDGTFSTLLNSPNGAITLTSLTYNKWQILNNIGFLTTLSNATLNQLTATNAIAITLSSVQDNVSTLYGTQINVSNNLQIEGDTYIGGGIIAENTVLLKSTLFAQENIILSSALEVVGESFFSSSLAIDGKVEIYGAISTPQDLIIGQNLIISSGLFANSLNIGENLSIKDLFINVINDGGGARIYGNTTIASNLYLGDSLFINGIGDIRDLFSVYGETKVYGNLDIKGNANLANVYIGSTLSVVEDINIYNDAYIKNILSTTNNVYIQNSTLIQGYTYVNGDVTIEDSLDLISIFINGSAYVSSLSVSSSLGVGNSLFISNNLSTTGIISGYSNIGVGGDVYSLNGSTIFNSNLSTFKNLSIENGFFIKSSIYINANTIINSNIQYVSSSLIHGTVSTGSLDIQGNMYIGGGLTIKGFISATTIESPISFEVSTLNLSNSLEANSGYIPYFFGDALPSKIFFDDDINRNYSQDYYVPRVLYVSTIINQEGYTTNSQKVYETNIIKASTTLIPYLPSSFIVGDSNYSSILGNNAIFNVKSLFNTLISSTWLSTNRINASSFTGNFIGDGAGISNATSFGGSFNISSLTASNIYTTILRGNYLQTSTASLNNNLIINRYNFISTLNLWLAAGIDSTRANIERTYDQVSWSNASSNNFQYFARGITGNGDIANPLFVAVGGDSRTEYTIQWSRDVQTWSPVITGGFSNALGNVKIGNGIAYLSPNRWVAVGLDALSNYNTIQYSSDGFNWSGIPATSSFRNEGYNVRAANNVFIATGFDTADSNTNIIKYSPNGMTWSTATISITPGNPILSFSYGKLDFGGGNIQNAWLAGASNGTTYYSLDNGSNWTLSVASGLSKFNDIFWNGSLWVAVGSNGIQYSATGFSWTAAATSFTTDILFKSIYFNSNTNIWVAGAQNSNTPLNTLWYSSNANIWTRINQGGFSTAINNTGAGYTIITTPQNSTITGGTGSLTGADPISPQIFNIIYNNASNNFITSTSYIGPGVFSTAVRAIGYTASEEYPFVAVGNGIIPIKTIGRAKTENGPWFPAITGGFSTTGYGVVSYNNDIWIAVGDSQLSTNTIQYSTDGTNWYGTNNAGVFKLGGRGVAIGDVAGSPTALMGVGRDTTPVSTIGLSSDGYNWIPITSGGFSVQGNSIVRGQILGTPIYLAVGIDATTNNTIQYSLDGFTWNPVITGGFTGGGNGIFYQNVDGQDIFIAVGSTNNTTQPTTNYTIQYSYDGCNFSPTVNAFTRQGFGVTYNVLCNLFFAVGEDSNALPSGTIKYSANGITWSNIAPANGFTSEALIGTANSLYTQLFNTEDIYSYLEFSKLVIYERETARNYNRATIRVQSSFMYLNEAVQVNLSSQMIINGSNAVSTALLTVYGDVYASSFIFNGDYSNDTKYTTQLLTTSSLYGTDGMVATTIALSTHVYIGPTSLYPRQLAANTLFRNKITFQSAFDPLNSLLSNIPPSNAILGLNDTMYLGLASQRAPFASNVQTIGINMMPSAYGLDVSGNVGTSSFSTKYVMANLSIAVAPTQILPMSTPNILFYTSTVLPPAALSLPTNINTIQFLASTTTINRIVDIIFSTTQSVGIFSRNPVYPFEVPRAVVATTLSTNVLRLSTFFLTMQSI